MKCRGSNNRSSRPEVFLGKGVLKICSKFTGEHPCRSLISIKLQSNWAWVFLLKSCCIFSEHLFLGTPLEGCFRNKSHLITLVLVRNAHLLQHPSFGNFIPTWIFLVINISKAKLFQRFTTISLFVLKFGWFTNCGKPIRFQ